MWNASAIACLAPPAYDLVTPLRLSVGGQEVLLPAALGYAPPVVTATARRSGAFPTAGGGVLALSGSGFPLPPWPVAVLVGSLPCVVDAGTRSTTELQCVLPRGAGAVIVVVRTPVGRGSEPVAIAYDPPGVSDVVTPAGRPIEGHFLVELRGTVR